MDYEKAYKKAVEKLRYKISDNDGNIDYNEVVNADELQDIFPELAESEDESIRKALLEYFGEECDTATINGIYCYKIYAWLEKHKPVEHLELKVGHWYVCYRAFCCRADHLTVREGERFMCEKDGVVKGFVIKDAEKYFKECNAPAPYEDEQKPKWSKEDEEEFKIAIETLYEAGQHSSAMWLKSIKQRLEEQQ